MVLEQYTYVFAIGTCFALLEAYNNGANDVANAWATSVSSRSLTYRQAMLCCLVFELTGALTVGARTADTIRYGIIPLEGFQGNAGVQLLAFACAAGGAATWVMWCTRHSAHVSSTYSLVSSIAGVGVAAVGAANVEWGWNGGQGLGAIFGGLLIAPLMSAIFASTIFMLIKTVVHMRTDPVPWAVWTSPFFFFIAGTICSLSIVFRGSPKLNLDEKPGWFIAMVSLSTGAGLAILAALFFVPYVHCKVIKKDYNLRLWEIIKGPSLFYRPAPADAHLARVPNYAVLQHGEEHQGGLSRGDGKDIATVDDKMTGSEFERSGEITPPNSSPGGKGPILLADNVIDSEKLSVPEQQPQADYKRAMFEAREKHHAELRQKSGPLGWGMRTLHNNPPGAGAIYELHNLKAFVIRLPAMIVVALLYGLHYDIHRAQIGVLGTPEGYRMARVYNHAAKYQNEVEYLYSFVQIITACTASFAHGANDVGNAVGVWAAMYTAWKTSQATEEENDVPLWQIAVVALTICTGFITYGYNIMKVMGNKITYHSPSRGSSMEMGAAITILFFSQFSLPTSTSMCITGATVGVGLCNGSFKAVNWQRVGLLFFSWIMTIPIAGLIGGCTMGLFLNAPGYGERPGA